MLDGGGSTIQDGAAGRWCRVAALVGLALFAATLPAAHRPGARRRGARGGRRGRQPDRPGLTLGYVVDFVDFYWRGWHFWAFNVADAAITVGMALDHPRPARSRTTPCIPELFKLGPITIYSYGVLLAASYLLGLRWRCRAPSSGASTRTACSTSASTSSSPRSSARSCCCSSSTSTSSATHPADLLSLARSGGVFYGGLILAVVVAFWYIARHEHAVLDDLRRVRAGHRAGARHRPAGLLRGRLLLRQADRRAVGGHLHRPAGRGQRRHAARHPAPSDAALRGRRRAADPGVCCSRPNGAAAASPAARSGLYMFLYAVSRYVIEIYRGDPRGVAVSRRLSTSQFISRDPGAAQPDHAGCGCRAVERREPVTAGAPRPTRRSRQRPDGAARVRGARAEHEGQRLDRFLVVGARRRIRGRSSRS